MNDRHKFQDHRMAAAQSTNQSNGRGYFFPATDAPPMWLRAISECFRIRSLIIFAVMGGVVALWWL
jgi:hypothetical protein